MTTPIAALARDCRLAQIAYHQADVDDGPALSAAGRRCREAQNALDDAITEVYPHWREPVLNHPTSPHPSRNLTESGFDETVSPRWDAILRLEEAQTEDEEHGHMKADDALVELLRALGYHDVCEAYEKVHKWYA